MHLLDTVHANDEYAREMCRFIILALRLLFDDKEHTFDGLRSAGIRLAFSDSAIADLRNIHASCTANADDQDPARDAALIQKFLFNVFTGGLSELLFHEGLTLYFGLLAVTHSGWKQPHTLTTTFAAFKYNIRLCMITSILDHGSDARS
jgi:hypothetical protein